MPSPVVERVLASLQSTRHSGNGWTARCPAHDDQHSSLSIHEGPDGRVLLHFHAGCEVGEIVKAIDLELRDLFPESVGQPGNRAGHHSTTQTITVERLARDKGLTAPFLRELGLRDRPDGILIPYL